MPNDCVIWPGSRYKTGYGQCWRNGKTHHAHRIAWESAHGPIPKGLCVLHRCDNRPCVNIDHLFLGTRTDNHLDKVSKGRMLIGMALPQTKLTPEDISNIRASGLTQEALAKRYGVNQGHISKIKNNLRRNYSA